MKNKFLMISVLFLMFVMAGCFVTKPKPFNALGNWETDGSEVYTIDTNTNSLLAFSYNKGTSPDAFLRSSVIDKDLSKSKKLVITVQGTGTMLLRLECADNTPSKEVGLNVTGIKGTYEWNLLNSSDFLKSVKRIVIIASPGKEKSVGNIEITQLAFSEEVADGFIIQDDFNNIPSNVNEYNGTDENFNFNAKWENFAEEVYEITVDGDVTKVSFSKSAGAEWACMQSLVKGDFTNFNYVVVKIKGTKDQSFIVKAAPGFEKQVKFSGDAQEVVVDISKMSNEEKNAIPSILLFGIPGGIGSGSFEIIEAYMTAEFDVIVPEIIKNEYNGIDQEFSLFHWYDNGDMVYEVEEDNTNTIITYQKDGPQHNYSLALTHIVGDISHFDIIEIELTGTANKSVMFKIEGSGEFIEANVAFDGTRQLVKIDLKGMSNAALKAVNKLMVFAAPGGIGSGTFTIHSATFKTDEFSLTDVGWVSNDEGVYTFTKTEDGLVVNYDKGELGWAFMKYTFGAEQSIYNTLELVFKGLAGKELLVKPNDSGPLEKKVTFDENGDASLTVTADSFNSLIIFAEPDVLASGSFTIVKAVLKYVAPSAIDPSIDVDVNFDWLDNDGGIYEFAEVDGQVVVTYERTSGQSWAFIKNIFKDDLSNHNTIEIVVKGEVGSSLIIKPNDSAAFEKTVEFNGEEQLITFTLTETPHLLMIFVDPINGSLAGEFTIISCKVKYVVGDYNFETDWVSNDEGVYTFTKTEDGLVVNYDKGELGWAFMKYTFGAEQSIYNTLELVFKGLAGKELLVKPNDSGPLEKRVTFDENGDASLTVTADSFNSLIIFAEPDVLASGSFTIVKAVLKYVESGAIDPSIDVDVNFDWLDNDGGIYEFAEVDGKVVVTYERTSGQSWAFIKNIFKDDLSNHNTIELVVKGEVGTSLIIKPNDNGAFEKTVEFNGEEQLITFTLTETPHLLMIFVDPINGSLAGEFIIISCIVKTK